jgi:hypothetical protein
MTSDLANTGNMNALESRNKAVKLLMMIVAYLPTFLIYDK